MGKNILVDFDGTIVESAFPKIGPPMLGAFEVLREMKEAGHKLILWTCREDEGYNINKQYLRDAIKFCLENGIEFDAVNKALDDDFRSEHVQKRKPHADFHIDDRNLGGFPGWDAVRAIILEGKSAKWSLGEQSVCVWEIAPDDPDYYTSCSKEFYVSNEQEPYEYCPGCGRVVEVAGTKRND